MLSKLITGLSVAPLYKVINCFNCRYYFAGNFYWAFKLQLSELSLCLSNELSKAANTFQLLQFRWIHSTIKAESGTLSEGGKNEVMNAKY